jgi:hypothetical protein
LIKITLAVFSIAVAALIGSSIAYGQQSGIYEDQFIVCNFEAKCTIINTDEYLSERASDDLWIAFNNDMDTFDMESLHD